MQCSTIFYHKSWQENHQKVFLLFSSVLLLTLFSGFQAISQTFTYTTDAQFDQGVLNGVIHTPSNQLQLSNTASSVDNFAWIANSGDATVSKINTLTGVEVGRYCTGPAGVGNIEQPARVVVDINGNCWVANRHYNNGQGTITEILKDGGVDRNGNGTIETSTGASDVKAWGLDERVVRNYNVGNPNVGGTSGNGGIPRAILVDKKGFLWVGLWAEHKVVKIDPDAFPITTQPLVSQTPTQLASLTILLGVSMGASGPYGLAVNSCGKIYVSTVSDSVYEIDPGSSSGGTDPARITKRSRIKINNQYLGVKTYGIAVDSKGIVWYGDYAGKYGIIRWDPCLNTFSGGAVGALSIGRGVAVDFNDKIWVAYNLSNNVARWSNNVNPTTPDFVKPVTNQPIGVGIDKNGDVVVVRYGATAGSIGTWSKFHNDGTAGTFTTQAPANLGTNPYTYGDFTGIQARRGLGDWTVTKCTDVLNNQWTSVSWTASVPTNSSLIVEARAANDAVSLASAIYSPVNNGTFSGDLCGKCIQVRVRFAKDLCIASTDTNSSGCNFGASATPILYDLTLNSAGIPCPQFTECDTLGFLQRWQIPNVPDIQGLDREPWGTATKPINKAAWFTEFNENQVGRLLMPDSSKSDSCTVETQLSEYNVQGVGDVAPFKPFKVAYGTLLPTATGATYKVWLTDPANGKFAGMDPGTSASLYGQMSVWQPPVITGLKYPFDIQIRKNSPASTLDNEVWMTDSSTVGSKYLFSFRLDNSNLARWTLPFKIKAFYARNFNTVWLAGWNLSVPGIAVDANVVAVLNPSTNILQVWEMKEIAGTKGDIRAITVNDSGSTQLKRARVYVALRKQGKVFILDSLQVKQKYCVDSITGADGLGLPKPVDGASRVWTDENLDGVNNVDALNLILASPSKEITAKKATASKAQWRLQVVTKYRAPYSMRPVKPFCEEIVSTCSQKQCIIHDFRWENDVTMPIDFFGSMLDIDMPGVYWNSGTQGRYNVLFHEPKHKADNSGWIGRFQTIIKKP